MRPLFQFPVWQFLKQPLFEAHYNPILNPARFWNLYQIDFLERCLDREFESNSHGGQVD
jgi:hypothetical protein